MPFWIGSAFGSADEGSKAVLDLGSGAFFHNLARPNFFPRAGPAPHTVPFLIRPTYPVEPRRLRTTRAYAISCLRIFAKRQVSIVVAPYPTIIVIRGRAPPRLCHHLEPGCQRAEATARAARENAEGRVCAERISLWMPAFVAPGGGKHSDGTLLLPYERHLIGPR